MNPLRSNVAAAPGATAIEAKDNRGGLKDSAHFFALDRILLIA
jgi:hypothetical protein